MIPSLGLLEATLLSRDALWRLTSEGKDIDSACDYPLTVSTDDYKTMFDRNGVAKRVVSVWPEECWSSTPEVYETENANTETEFEKAWQALVEEHSVLEYLERVDVLSGVGQFGIILIGLDDGLDLSQPVQGKVGRKLTFIKIVDESAIEIKEKELNPSNPRFGQPIMYSIAFEKLDRTNVQEKRLVHWSRIVHIADNRLSSDLYGTPRMKDVYNYLLDLKKIGGGSGEMFWRGGFPGIAFKINPERTDPLTEAEKAAIRTEMTNYANGMQRYLALTNMEAKSMAPQVADPGMHAELQLKLIATTKGIPYRIFIGTEEAKLSSTQDMKTWYRRVMKRQRGYLTPRIIRPFVDRLMGMGVMPLVQQYFVDWPELGALDEKDAAEVAERRTNAFAKYVAGSVGDSLIAPMEYLTMYHGLSPEEATQVINGLKARLSEIDDDVHQDRRSSDANDDLEEE